MRSILSLMGLTILVAAVGCGRSDSYDGVIGVSVLTTQNPFFLELAGAIKEEAQKHNFKVLVTSGERDPARQKDQIEDFIVKHVDAIVLCPCDSKAMGTSIAEANQEGIPVFTADIACLAKEAKVVCHVASDNEGGGHLAAKAMIEALGGSGKIAILDFPEVESVMLRTKGFREELRNTPGIEIVAVRPGGGLKGESHDATEDLLQSHPELGGIFAINDPSGLGAVSAIETADAAGDIKIVAFDAQPEGRRAVKDGKFYATIVQYPRKIGQKVAAAVFRYLAGEPVEPEILIPCTIYRRADADEDPSLK
jgi:ribose transport system substrate-binding protein